MATMSIIALYNWDQTIFDDMVMPSFIDKDDIPHVLDRDTLINSIMMETGELETLFANSDKMKELLKIWSMRRVSSWSRMYEVLDTKYDPFINIVRDETRTIKQERNLKGTYKGKVNAWNSTSPVDRDSSETGDTGDITTTENYHLEGDSAITDAQDIMRKEVEARKQYNIYDIITEEFKRRFCIMVY